MAMSKPSWMTVTTRYTARSSQALALSVGLAFGSGCVSQSAFEEAQSAAEVEREAHQRAEARLQEVERPSASFRMTFSVARRRWRTRNGDSPRPTCI